MGTLCGRKSASTHSRVPEKTPTTSPRSPYHRKCPNNVSGDAQRVPGSTPRPPRSPVPPWRNPEAPPPLRKYKRNQWFLLISTQLCAAPHRLPSLPQDHGGRLGVALLRSMDVAGESRGVAREPFEHPGSLKRSPRQPSGALGAVQDFPRCGDSDFQNIEKLYFLLCFQHQ